MCPYFMDHLGTLPPAFHTKCVFFKHRHVFPQKSWAIHPGSPDPSNAPADVMALEELKSLGSASSPVPQLDLGQTPGM